MRTHGAGLIQASPSAVAFHVRRQDYLTSRVATLGFVGRHYYETAVADMVRCIPNAHLLHLFRRHSLVQRKSFVPRSALVRRE